MSISINELLAMTNEELIRQFKGQTIIAYLKNGDSVSGIVQNFEEAHNSPNLFCAFIINSKSVSFMLINQITIE